MKFLAVIPARYASTRFPGKPLALIGDKPMIQHVYEQAKKAVEDVVVATDDKRIYDAVEAFGGKVLLTSDKHRSGTDRCFEALQKMSGEYDVVINIQGDEPFIQPEQIETLKACFTDPKTEIATLIKPFDKGILKDLEKAIQMSDINLPTQNDGTVIRLVFPPLTEQTRKQ